MNKSRILVLTFLVLFYGTILTNAYNDTEYARVFITNKCKKCDLYKASFFGANLTNVDFSGSNLILANFQKSTLFNANLSNTSIQGANFEGALWIDGSICQKGSYGRCIKKEEK